MKRRFTFLLTALLLLSGIVWGQARTSQELTFPLSSNPGGWPTSQSTTLTNYTYTLNNVTYTFALKNVKCNNGYLMIYQPGALGLPAIEGYKLTKVVASNSGGCSTSVKVGISSSGTEASYIDGGAIQTWSTQGSTYTYNLTSTEANTMYYLYVTNKNGQVTSLTLTYESTGGGTPSVATPTFSPAAGTYYEAQNVTIGCTTDGATIHYTLDGTDPTTASATYSTPIAISQTTIVKAMAVKSGMNNSSIASATYTIQAAPTVITIAAARALALNEYALVQGVVTFIDGTNIYVQDETAGIDLYLNSGTVPSGLALGDKVQAYGKRAVYKGLIELSGINGGEASQFSVISTGNTLPLAEKTIAEILADHAGTQMLQSTRVKIVNATIGTINTSNNTPLTQGESTTNIYKVPALTGITAGDAVDVIGVIGCYNAPQLRVAYASDVTIHETPMEPVATPTFTPAAGEYTEAQNVTIACSTEGAAIYYTLDGTDPTYDATSINGTQYNAAIAITETTTVKAIAIKEGMTNSDIASATYTINIPAPTLTFNKLSTHTDVTDNGVYMIVDVAGGYALTSANGTGSAPAAVAVTIENDAISGEIDEALQWNIKAVDGGYTINPVSNAETFLYTTNTNNGVRVGANDNKVWELNITDSNKPNYHGFKNVAFSRYLGVYNNSNWRTYTSIGANIENTQIEIFVLGEAPVHTYYAVNVAEGITNGTVTAAPTSAEEGTTITVTAEAAQGYQLTALTYTYAGVATPIDIMETMQFVMPAAEVTVNATFTELATVATPTFTPAEGSYISVQTVSLACATEGATIYYTLDGTDPTTESTVYAGAFTVSTTTTVKAMAAKEGMNNSAVASATITIIEPMSIAEARALENNQYALVQGVVTFIDGRNVYVQDATAGIDLYLNSNTVPSTLALGDMVKGYGKKTVYNGLTELTSINGGNENQFLVLSNGNQLPVTIKTIAEILADHEGEKMLQSTRVQIVEATIGTINTSNNTPITQGESTMNIYKMPVVEGLLANDIVTVTGVLGCYNAPQLRINSAEEVTYVHPPVLTVNPASIAALNYVEGEGPSTPKTFTLSASNLVGPAFVFPSENFEISSVGGNNFIPETRIRISGATNFNNLHIYVRLKAGLELGTYEESLYACSTGADTVYVAVSGSVTEPPVASDYARLTDLTQLNNGAKVIFAARFDENANDYYAMTAQASGKPTGVLFTSVTETTETLPGLIADADSLYYWTVTIEGDNYTFTNANGDVLGYTSSTNFSPGGDNINWTIAEGTSEDGAMVPNYTGFVVTNANVTNRAFALNSNHNYGPYHIQNLNANNYNFFLDMFFIAGSGTVTYVCATPTITPAGGTYFEEQEVTLSCSTADATIYYTLDGSDPTENSTVYTEPFTLSENTTVKAIAMKEDYENSDVAEAEFVFMLDAVTIFNQDWEGEMNGWTFVTVEGSKPWTIAQYQGNHYANANGYNGGVNEQWCISPAFSLEQYSDVSLSFRNAMKFTGPDMELFFSNNYDGEDPATADWTALEYVKSEGNYVWAESGAISLDGFTGTDCYIGFKYTSTETEAASWEIDDILLIGFTSDPVLTVTPQSLSFTYIEGNGPSAEQSIVVSGFNLTENVTISTLTEEFEISETSGDDFVGVEEIEIEPENGAVDMVIYVRMVEGLEIGNYDGSIMVESELDDVFVTLSGTVNEPIQSGDWNRIGSLADLHDGDQLVIASRYDATVGDGYYAMTAEVSGKPDGVLFTSVNNEGIETLPDEIVADIATFVWTVTVNDTVITLTNANGDMLGYSSSTNFAGNTNTDWAIIYGTSGENAMVPNYNGFVITNTTTTNRGIAKNTSNKFGAYSTSNINNADYNFYLDLFVLGGSATQTVATPVFSVASGTYYEEFDVEITCATEGAIIYYTEDGSDPTAQSMVYDAPIHVSSDITLKAIAMMEGYENSGIATVNYVVVTGVAVILNQDWEGEMNGWTFVTVEGNKPWNVSSYGGNHYAYANGYNDDTDNEQWCISPTFDLTYYTNVVLTFRNAVNYTGPALELYFADDYDGQDPTAASWQPLEFNMSTGGYAWTESGEISLDGFRSENCNIAFRYISTLDEGAAAWEVDDILITGTAYNAIEETELSDVNVWNFGNELFVENQTNGTVNMMVFNLLGQPVYTTTIGNGSVRFSHNLAKGVYVVTLLNGKETKSVKMVVR